MKVAVVQTNASGNKQQNIDKAVNFVQKAARRNAKFVLFPEAFNYRGPASLSDLNRIKEKIPGESTRALMASAKKHKVYLLAGSICEDAPGKKKVYNTSTLISPQGKIKAAYRKMNLFDAVIGKRVLKESNRFLCGVRPVVTAVEKFKVGLSICYDLRFSDLYEAYKKRGVHILTVPAVFTKVTGKAHWEILLRARAIESLSYVLAPNQIGKDARGVASYGNSMIINPWGEVLARASSNKEEIIYAELDLATIKEKRKILPGI